MNPMLLLFVALFNSVLGFSVLFPIFAPLGRELGLSETEVGLLSTGYALMQFLFAAQWGRRSESWGRRPVLLTGILGFAGGFLLFGVVGELGLRGLVEGRLLFALLLLGRVLGGALSSATLPTAQAYAADLSGREDRTAAMAMIGAAFGLALIFGPAIGAGIARATGSLLAPVYFSCAVALANALFVALRLPEPERAGPAPGEEPPEAERATLTARVWPLLAVGLATTVASVAMQQTVAFAFMDRLRLDELEAAEVVGIALALYGMVAVLTQGVIVRRVRWTPRTLMLLGLPAALGGFVLFVFAESYGALLAALLLQGFGQGLALPGVTSATSLAVGDGEQGAVAGLASSAQGLGRTVGPVVGTPLYELDDQLPYGFGAVMLALGLVALLARPGLGVARPRRVT
ncbi:MAG: MFS transporter [Sandaracinaceae bacterium]